jgi:hypothetical protein
MAENNNLEERVATLEREVAELRALLKPTWRVKDPRRTFGMFKNDPTYAEIVELGRKWREKENRKSLENME